MYRRQGLIVARGNPLQLRRWPMAARGAHGQPPAGSGTHAIDLADPPRYRKPGIDGYAHEEFTDAVATVANGSADAGFASWRRRRTTSTLCRWHGALRLRPAPRSHRVGQALLRRLSRRLFVNVWRRCRAMSPCRPPSRRLGRRSSTPDFRRAARRLAHAVGRGPGGVGQC
jgi:hypothetical protein